MMRRLSLLLVLTSLFLSACERNVPAAPPGAVVLASTMILTDITRNVAGERLQVASLLPWGADPHEFQASPSDVQRISEGKVVVMNGLGYERFLQPLLDNASGERMIITASDGLQPLQIGAGTGQGAPDPHMWLDPRLVERYVENIRDGLSAYDPDGAATYRSNAKAYINRLKELDDWILQQVRVIPLERRLLVTNHEAWSYFAERYDFTIVATVIPSVSTEAGTSARELAAVIDQVRATGARVILVGALENADLARQVADETGAVVVDGLYLETLTSGSPAQTYIQMMEYNVKRIVQALKLAESSSVLIAKP